MAQVQQIYPILSYHYNSLIKGKKAISPCLRQHIFAIHHPSDIYPFYLQAVSAFSRKNHELTLQHITAVKRFFCSEFEYCLIIEDDSIPACHNHSHFEQEIETCLQYLHAHPIGYYDISDSFGIYANTQKQQSEDLVFCRMAPGQTRCASSYLLTRGSARILLDYTTYPVLPVDWHLSYILSKSDCPTFWHNQPLFTQGSQAGLFQSNQASRNAPS
jgi:GR25 family glycosyltransferase involved in LPS biosynthesis